MHFGGRSGISRSAARPSFRAHRSFAVHGNRAASRRAAVNSNRSATLSRNATLRQNRNAAARSAAVQRTLNSRAMSGALRSRTALANPNTRAQMIAAAATAGSFSGRRGTDGWWRHAHGGYGWIGPLFWPFAYYDIYDYALWGYGYDPLFWDYGYNDIYAGLFYPYGYDDLVGYMPSGGGSRVRVARARDARAEVPNRLAQMCGDDSRDIAGLPIDQIQQTLQLNDEQRAALDELANASVKAAQEIKAACPTQIALTAPERLASMQQRIEAMLGAVRTVQPTLQKFYDLLNDEQRARLNALAQNQRRREAARNTPGSLTQGCRAAQPGVTDWPTAEIEARLQLNEAQRANLAALQQASAKAAEMLQNSCPTGEPITPPARLEAIANRLETMLQAVKTVRAALDDVYNKLTDEQKAQFEAIGPARSALSNPPADSQARARRYGG
jgi:LTXXQ motif family protein